jgi:hypothetical protein
VHVAAYMYNTATGQGGHWRALPLYRQTVYAFGSALTCAAPLPDGDIRPAVWQVMDASWCHPTLAEAQAWGTYPYDSDPAGTATRALARPICLRLVSGPCGPGSARLASSWNRS